MTTAPAAPAGTDDANCRHLYGYGDPNHKPSILQTITKYVCGVRVWVTEPRPPMPPPRRDLT
jgi:hypothetical protein